MGTGFVMLTEKIGQYERTVDFVSQLPAKGLNNRFYGLPRPFALRNETLITRFALLDVT